MTSEESAGEEERQRSPVPGGTGGPGGTGRPPPAARPTEPRPPTSRPPAPRPASSGAGAAPSAPRAPQRPSASGASSASSAPAARASAAARPARPARTGRPEPEPEEEEREHYAPEPERTLDDATKIGLFVAGGLALVVGLILFFVLGQKRKEREAHEAYEAAVLAVHTDIKKLDVTKEADAKKILDLGEDKRTLWASHDLATDIENVLMRARTTIEGAKEQRENLGRLEQIEKAVQDPSGLSPEAIKEQRRRLDELEAKAVAGGPELLARFTLARAAADRAYANRLVEDASQFAKSNASEQRLALTRYEAAEDEMRPLLDRAYRDKQKELQDFYTPLYQKLVAESDQLVLAMFPDDAIEKLPVIDCLSGTQAAKWNPTAVKGFSHRVEGGVLQIIGPDADAGRSAVVSIGDLEQWRHFLLDIEFTIEQGNFEMLFHLGRNVGPNVITHHFMTKGDDAPLRAGRANRCRITLVAGRLRVKYPGDSLDEPPPFDEAVPWVRNRKGAIGLVIPPGTRVKFTKFQVRELR